MSEFTKGVWHVGSYFGHCSLHHKHGQGDCVYEDIYCNNKAHVSVTKDDGSHTILISCNEYGDILSKADARLIAAAPDLLAALQALAYGELKLPMVSERKQREQLQEMALAAIAKATGESQ